MSSLCLFTSKIFQCHYLANKIFLYYTLNEENDVFSTEQRYSGFQAYSFTNYFFRSSPEARINWVKNRLSKNFPIKVEKLVIDSDFRSRISKHHLNLRIRSKIEKKPMQTSGGKGFTYTPSALLQPLVRDFSEYFFGVDINRSYPKKETHKTILLDQKILGKMSPKKCSIKSKWFDLSLEVKEV